MSKLGNLCAAALSCLVYTSDASERTITLGNDRGGSSGLYEQRAEALGPGTRVQLAGFCASACTIYLWRRYGLDVCALPGSTLLFHKPGFMEGLRPMTGPLWASEADRLWMEEDMAQLPRNIVQLLARAPIPSMSEGASPWEVVAIRALDVLPACE